MIKAAAERVSEPALPFDDRGLARPPWEALPDIPRYSIGWRMGGGEDYWLAFHEWFRVQGPEKRKHYIAIYPEPDAWSGFYEQAGLDMAARK